MSAMCFDMYGFSVRAANDNALRKSSCASMREDSTCCDSAMLIPVSDYSCDNKTISDKISKKDERSYKEYNIIIPLGRFIRERTQRIFPYPPQSHHQPNVESGSSAM